MPNILDYLLTAAILGWKQRGQGGMFVDKSVHFPAEFA